jgi:hypothetical protein
MSATFEELTAQFQELLLAGDTNSEQLYSLVDALWQSAPADVIQQWTEIAQRLGYTQTSLPIQSERESS